MARWRAVLRATVAALALLGAASCKEGGPPVFTGGPLGDGGAIVRPLVDSGPIGPFEGGLPPPSNDASSSDVPMATDARSTRDGARDGTPSTDASTDAVAAVRPCDLVKQDCPNKAYGCYRASNRRDTMCAVPIAIGVNCIEDTACDLGLLCIQPRGGQTGMCLEICGPGRPCRLERRCVQIEGYEPAGYCDF